MNPVTRRTLSLLYTPWRDGLGYMGFKKTSETLAISFALNESAANTWSTEQIALTLSPLDQEVFVVVAVDLDPTAPEALPATRTSSNANLTKSLQTSFLNLGNSNTIAVSNRSIISSAADVLRSLRVRVVGRFKRELLSTSAAQDMIDSSLGLNL